MRSFWRGFRAGMVYVWFPFICAEILLFAVFPWPEPAWEKYFLALLGAFLGGIVEAGATRTQR